MLLEVKKLSVSYGKVNALNDISFCVNEGEVVALLGPNGAGKSTALRAITGLLKVVDGEIDKGEITFQGKSIKGLRTDELVKKGISLVPEGRRIFPTMGVLENLQMGAYTLNDKLKAKELLEKVFALFPKLKERRRQKAGTLSSGEQQMLAMGRALMLEPTLLLLDEPSLGLSPKFVETVFEKIKEINQQGTTILMVEQNVRMALKHSNRAYIFKIGEIALEGSSRDLLENKQVKEIFFGNSIH